LKPDDNGWDHIIPTPSDLLNLIPEPDPCSSIQKSGNDVFSQNNEIQVTEINQLGIESMPENGASKNVPST
jgi:hypothetical protein